MSEHSTANTCRMIEGEAIELARLIAGEIVDLVANRKSKGAQTVLALPVGRSPALVFAELIKRSRSGQLDSDRLTIFGLDEVVAEPTRGLGVFARRLRLDLLDQLGIPERQIHFLDGGVAASSFSLHCATYEAAIVAAGGIDLALLGLGRNAHVAFNEPGSAITSRTRVVTLDPSSITDLAHLLPPGAPSPAKALTVGLATILDARRVRVLATGLAKRDAVAAMVLGEPHPDRPASLLRGHPDLALLVDRDAAAGVAPALR